MCGGVRIHLVIGPATCACSRSPCSATLLPSFSLFSSSSLLHLSPPFSYSPSFSCFVFPSWYTSVHPASPPGSPRSGRRQSAGHHRQHTASLPRGALAPGSPRPGEPSPWGGLPSDDHCGCAPRCVHLQRSLDIAHDVEGWPGRGSHVPALEVGLRCTCFPTADAQYMIQYRIQCMRSKGAVWSECLCGVCLASATGRTGTRSFVSVLTEHIQHYLYS